MAFVVDNSVVVGWHLSSQTTAYSDSVLKAMVTNTAHVPGLWVLEFSNVMRKALLAKKITQSRCQEIFLMQKSLALSVHPDVSDPAENLALAMRYQLSSYDAAYLELAMRLHLPVATSDGALRDASVAAGVGVFTPK
ncbi:MAG: hypothetical protein AUJ20_00645 [Comamonadaceae bacterium CG1_02_60_18]|nr:MAG: hypothetical protein AUJ20_00645 [Comamonadaceae bacterium CG1_02_60_18]PIQ52154.1 MAG: VapC toxin family PIN domain ribonuclease [Comamonadaceae bacterium CG12_big_fil_rev_8_21_14_0_65_59_15]